MLRNYGQHFVDGQGGANSLGVPYVKTYKDPAHLQPPRDTVLSNVTDIMSDFQGGIALMSNGAVNQDSSYMSADAAYALMARAALYFGSVDSSFYATAGTAAKWVIDNSSATPVSASAFKASYYTDNASNSLFELEATGTDNPSINGLAYAFRGTSYGYYRILTGDNCAACGDDLYDIFAADAATDVRFTVNGMIGTQQGEPTVIGKYPTMNGTDNITIIRVEEMHLIYAEALLRAGNAAGALTYLNNIPAIRGGTPYTTATLDNIPLDFDTLQEHGCFIGSAAVVVLSDRDNMKDIAKNLMFFFHDESCGQCTPCRNGTEKALKLMNQSSWDVDLLKELSSAMMDASICGLGQAAPNPMLSVIKHFPEEVTN